MALNLAAITNITATTSVSANTGTAVTIIAAPSASTVVKINSLYAANTGSGTYTVDVYVVRSTVSFYLAKSLLVGTGTSTIVITKDAPVYLQETTDTLLVLCAGTTPTVTFTVSYEILS